MHHELSLRIFCESGGLDMLDAYGIDPEDDPLKAFSRKQYPSKKGSKGALAGMQPATLVADGKSIHLFAGIAPPERAPENFQMEGSVLPFVKKTTYPTKRMADLALKMMDAPRPFLIYVVGRSWPRALKSVTPTFDPDEVIVSGDVTLVFDRSRMTRILNVVARHDIRNIYLMRYIRDVLSNADIVDESQESLAKRISDPAIKALRITRKTPKDEKENRINALISDLRVLPSTLDEASWSIAARYLELNKGKKDADLG